MGALAAAALEAEEQPWSSTGAALEQHHSNSSTRRRRRRRSHLLGLDRQAEVSTPQTVSCGPAIRMPVWRPCSV